MLQNVLAQVISVFNLYKSMEADIEAGNVTGVHYDAARLVRMAIIFEPIEPMNETDLDRIVVPTEEQSAQDPDLNEFLLAKDPGLLGGKGSATAWLAGMATQAYDWLASSTTRSRPRKRV